MEINTSNEPIFQYDDDGEIITTLYGITVGSYFKYWEDATNFRSKLNAALFGAGRDWGIFSTIWQFSNSCKEDCKICRRHNGKFGWQEHIFSQSSFSTGNIDFTCRIGPCIVLDCGEKEVKHSIKNNFLKNGYIKV